MAYITTKRSGSLFILLLLCAALLTPGCANGPRPVWRQNHFQAMESEAIAKDILRFEADIAANPNNAGNSAPYFYLAMLHAHYNNPAPDYARSLTMCDKYLSLNPEGYRKGEVLYLKTLLQKLTLAEEDRLKYRKEVQKLNQTSQNLKEQNELVVLENRDLKAAIEKLEMLDLRLEEQRRDL